MQIENGEALAHELALLWLALEDRAYPTEELGQVSLDLSSGLRTLAIMSLLATGSTDRFFSNLERSAHARLMFLTRLKERNVDGQHHQASGRYSAVADAIAAENLQLARRIAELSPGRLYEGHEYKDDYCCAQLLHQYVQDRPDLARIDKLLTEFEEYADGAPNARLSLFRAFAGHDETAFARSFEDLVGERTAEIAKKIADGQLADDHVLAGRAVFVEGIAILRLAEKFGLRRENDEYQYCPRIALLPRAH